MASKHDHELEVKFLLGDKAAVERRLAAASAELVRERTFERNLRFDTPNHQLIAENQLLRLRQDHTVRLTFKGPSQFEDGVFSRQEIEVGLSDFEAGLRLLKALGFRVIVVYEKYRTTYSLDGLEVTIDELPLGDFLEIEGESREQIRGCADRLVLEWDAAISRNYLGLFEVCQTKLNLGFRDLTFENFKGIVVAPDDLGVLRADGG